MRRAAALALVLLGLGAARADDGLGLRRGGDPGAVSVSGLSSGAAMAVQYAVAHSGHVTGVGSVAGPLWGCAEGSASLAVNACMCGGEAALPTTARTLGRAADLARSGRIDRLVQDRPTALRRAYVFQSPDDETVRAASGGRNAEFLTAFTGEPATVDRGEAGDGSDRAGHGILSPAGDDSCPATGAEGSFVRRCGDADNAGRIFAVLYGDAPPGARVAQVPDADVWSFDQQAIVDAVKADGGGGTALAYDRYDEFLPWLRDRSARRDNLDMAARGYLYVPPVCRAAGSACRVHVALHGCKQDPAVFAREAGYNNWAEHHRVIVVYPALARGEPLAGPACALPVNPLVDALKVGPNPNACWDWWGYLDAGVPGADDRYLTRQAPQMRVLDGIVRAATAPPGRAAGARGADPGGASAPEQAPEPGEEPAARGLR